MSQPSPPLRLDGPQIDEFLKALETAFESGDFVRILSRLNKKFASYVIGTTFRDNLFYMVSAANDDGWCGQLLAIVLDERPKDEKMQRFAIKMGLVDLPGVNAAYLEATVNSTGLLVDPILQARSQLETAYWICQIGIPGDAGFGGTGVLVAPDLVLTNEHVINPGRTIDLRRVQCLFDYRKVNATTIDPGRVVRLHPDWQPLTRSPSKSDGNGNATIPPLATELDYALLRLDRPIGNDPLGVASPGGATRLVESLHAAPGAQGNG